MSMRVFNDLVQQVPPRIVPDDVNIKDPLKTQPFVTKQHLSLNSIIALLVLGFGEPHPKASAALLRKRRSTGPLKTLATSKKLAAYPL